MNESHSSSSASSATEAHSTEPPATKDDNGTAASSSSSPDLRLLEQASRLGVSLIGKWHRRCAVRTWPHQKESAQLETDDRGRIRKPRPSDVLMHDKALYDGSRCAANRAILQLIYERCADYHATDDPVQHQAMVKQLYEDVTQSSTPGRFLVRRQKNRLVYYEPAEAAFVRVALKKAFSKTKPSSSSTLPPTPQRSGRSLRKRKQSPNSIATLLDEEDEDREDDVASTSPKRKSRRQKAKAVEKSKVPIKKHKPNEEEDPTKHVGPPRTKDQMSECVQIPHEHDVLFGKGSNMNFHKGNLIFRQLVWDVKDEYIACHRSLKYRISRKVVEAVLNLNPPGRFLEMSNDGWRDASAKKVNEKATQALREKKWRNKRPSFKDFPVQPTAVNQFFPPEAPAKKARSAGPRKTATTDGGGAKREVEHKARAERAARMREAKANEDEKKLSFPSGVDVGSHIEVHWPLDQAYYKGTVRLVQNDHVVKVRYDDDKFEEWVDMRKTKVRLAGCDQNAHARD